MHDPNANRDDAPGATSRAVLTIGLVFAFLALVVLGFFWALKATSGRTTLMGTTAKSEALKPQQSSAPASAPTSSGTRP